MEDWPDYLVERACRVPPAGCGIVAGTTAVVSFGDPVRPAVATLGINPSSGEFLGRDGLLDDDHRRLATLPSLRVSDHAEIDAVLGSIIVSECAGYFDRRPYRWFLPLDRILRQGAGVSYFDGSACHLDLVQWATSPLWAGLDDSVRASLLEEDNPFLVRQLRREHYRLVVVNGRTVIKWTQRAGVAVWRKIGHLLGPPSADLFVSDGGDGPTFVGWSCNLQSQAGALVHAAALAAFVAEHSGLTLGGRPPMEGNHIPKGSRLTSISELVDVLETWIEASQAERLGATGSYGGTPWLAVETPFGAARINADTRRDAVESLVAAARGGSGLRMTVTANNRGRLNKVSFEGCQGEGWYAYLDEPLSAPDSTIVL